MRGNVPDLRHEWSLAATAGPYVAGIDEAGRGAWAGPVVAAAVILPLDPSIKGDHESLESPSPMRVLPAGLTCLAGVRDSKQMTPIEREAAYAEILSVAIAAGVGLAAPEEIDALGIVPATKQAMIRAVASLSVFPSALLIDAVHLPEIALPQDVLFHADALCLTVAAASVIAKVSRDRLMVELDGRYRGYDFARHKGYGTVRHQEALARIGPSAIHRHSYAPIRALDGAWRCG